MHKIHIGTIPAAYNAQAERGPLASMACLAIYDAIMARYIPRTCPKCHDYFGVVVIHPYPEARTLPVDGYCASCQYRIKWSMVVGSVQDRHPNNYSRFTEAHSGP
jgi:hypothetical protein